MLKNSFVSDPYLINHTTTVSFPAGLSPRSHLKTWSPPREIKEIHAIPLPSPTKELPVIKSGYISAVPNVVSSISAPLITSSPNEIRSPNFSNAVYLTNAKLPPSTISFGSPNINSTLKGINMSPSTLKAIGNTREENLMQSIVLISAENERISRAYLEVVREADFLKSQLSNKETLNGSNVYLEEKVNTLMSDNRQLRLLCDERLSELKILGRRIQEYDEDRAKTGHIEEKYISLVKENDRLALTINDQRREIELIRSDLQENERRFQSSDSVAMSLKDRIHELEDINQRLQIDLSDRLAHTEKVHLDELRQVQARSGGEADQLRMRIMELEGRVLLNLQEDIEMWKTRCINLENSHDMHVNDLRMKWEAQQASTVEAEFRKREGVMINDIHQLQEKLNFNIEIIEGLRREKSRLEAFAEEAYHCRDKIRKLEEDNSKISLENNRLSSELRMREDLSSRLLLLALENERLHSVIRQNANEIEGLSEKLEAVQRFHSSKMEEIKVWRSNEYETKLRDYEKRVMNADNEKVRFMEELERMRVKCLESEHREILSIEFEQRAKELQNRCEYMTAVLNERNNEIETLKSQMREITKTSNPILVREMENKLSFLLNENERLNAIIVNRCRDMTTGWK